MMACVANLYAIQLNYFDKAKKSFNIDTSIVYTEKFLKSNESKNDSTEVVEAICFLANKYMDKSRYAYSEKILNGIYASNYLESNLDCKALVEMEYGNLFKYKSNYSLALEFYLKAYEKLRSSNNYTYFIKCNIELAEYYRKIGKLQQAKKYITTSLNLIRDNNILDKSIIIRTFSRAAAIENEMNAHRKSIIYSNKSIAIAHETQDKYAIATSLNELGFSYKNMQLNDTAEMFYKHAEKIWFEIGAEREAINAMNNRVMMYAHSGYPQDLIFSAYDSLILMVNNKNIDFSLTSVYQYLHLEYLRVGDTAMAYKYLTDYHYSVMADEEKKNDINIANISERYENEKAKKEIQLVSAELKKKNTESKRLYVFFSIVLIMIVVVSFLAYRLNKSKKELTSRNLEKDMLLKEIHHRVKNNLQVISSLLELQTQKVSDESTVNIMREGQNRVKAMSLIHKKLYQNEDLSKINFQDYIEDLCSALYQIYKPKNIDVTHHIETNNISFDIDTAIPLGLIINELVTNSYKYAFLLVNNPVLKIKLIDKKSGNYELIIADNGIGLPEDFDFKNTSTLGIQLVNQLTKQLFGKISYKNNSGAEFHITFKDTFARKLVD